MGNSNIFGYQSFESVKDVLFGLVRLNVKHLLLLHKVKFYKRLYLRSDLVHNPFWVSLISNGIHDECMTTVFSPLCTAMDNVHSQFYEYVNGCLLPVVYVCVFLFSVYISVVCFVLSSACIFWRINVVITLL